SKLSYLRTRVRGRFTDANSCCDESRRPGGGTRRLHDGQQGFTLIELMVALIILAIVVAALSKPLLGAFSTASHARSSEGAQAAVLRSADLLQADVLAARSPDRNTSRQRGVDSLSQALLRDARGSAVSDDPSDLGRSFDVFDILVASRTQLRMVVEADGRNAGAECVQWDAEDTARTRQVYLRRVLYSNRNCGGRVLASDTLIPRQPWVPTNIGETSASVPPVFTYHLLCNPDAAHCGGRFGSSAGGCRGWNSTNVVDSGLNAIVSLSFDMRSVEMHSGAPASSRSINQITFPAREATDYRRSLGCA
ncbi:MAG: prepilin-type N-terminal cleavage/methylation domain-containing protein, partial [Thermoleophilia bacterium]|nr:prepilin-type N-terminal cleavage/methylation domain-containing protein [Thermoleophilia bacterium]